MAGPSRASEQTAYEAKFYCQPADLALL